MTSDPDSSDEDSKKKATNTYSQVGSVGDGLSLNWVKRLLMLVLIVPSTPPFWKRRILFGS